MGGMHSRAKECSAGAGVRLYGLLGAALLQGIKWPRSFPAACCPVLRYNYCCCLAQCGRLEEAGSLLRQLLAAGAVKADDIKQDGDLAPLHAAFA